MIRQIDQIIWYYINTQWHNAFLDWLIPFLRNQYFWVPVYLFLFVFMLLNYGRKGLDWVIGFLLTFGAADWICASVIKPFVGRLRPCNNPDLQNYIHLLVECGGGKSFPSNHAANHFAFAAFINATIGKTYPGIRKWTWLWPVIVSYSQVYVGVHFPLDVLAGGLLGVSIGSLTGSLYNRYAGRLQPLPVRASIQQPVAEQPTGF
ncbi:MAG: phosphatase PAP2 family protein [Sphingobacteriales bacterium]|nr:MAG: phosphatase PAP2 family protein [Sphingobacteriales bacterium]